MPDALQSILIVDDEPVNIVILSELLGSDYQIRAATGGEKALAMIQSGYLPDLILLDVMMPGIDGYEVCKRIKAQDASKKIPVIFITGRLAEEDEIKGFTVGASDYITKPFKEVIVKVRLKSQLELKKHRDFLEWMIKEKTKEIKIMEEEYSNLFYRHPKSDHTITSENDTKKQTK